MKLLLRNRQAPGDVLMLTAAVRDLHRAHPGEYRTAVDTTCRELWENNPFVTVPFTGWEPDRVIDCQYPLVHDANRRPFHFIHGFVQDLVNVFEWEDLNDAILVRHSFGGIASTGAPSGGRSDESARELEEPHRR